MTENHNSKDSGSFVTGFMLGIAAGAVGYFAFGTQRGTQLRKKLQQEWESARENMASDNGADTSHAVVETAQSVFGHVKQVLQDSFSSFDKILVHEQPDKKVPKKKRTRSAKFKGV